jgi:putative ABC transport system permease protein
MTAWALAWRFARRDLNLRLRGLRLLVVCLFLGVATLAAIGSLASSIRSEISERGQEILGGDVEIAMTQREANEDEFAALRAFGRISATIRTRAMARRTERGGTDTAEAVLTELKGVDEAYPLVGELRTDPVRAAALREDQLWIGQALADRLDVGPGDRLRYGEADFTIAGIISSEPDRVGEGFTLGPVAITSLAGIRRTNLIRPGALFETKYRLLLPPTVTPAEIEERIGRDFAATGWEIRTRDNAAPGTNRFFGRLGEFLTLIGLAALAIAGIGVGNGVTAYLGTRRTSIATLKVLGATSADIARIHGLQILIVATGAILAGLVVGATVPSLTVALAGNLLPVRPGLGLHSASLALGAAYGLLITIIFALPPLARARREPAAAIYRARVDRFHRRDWPVLVGVAMTAAITVAIAIGTSSAPQFAAMVLAGVGGTLLLLLGLGWLARFGARQLPRPRSPLTALALGNLHRPGAQTISLTIALGLALTLFVTLAALQTSLDAEIRSTVPDEAPGQFVLDIPADQEARFRGLIAEHAPDAALNVVPALRGTITAYGTADGVTRVADLEEIPDDAWFLRGERGVTYSGVLPEGSDLVAGRWWPRDYAGPPLVSLDAEAANVLNLTIGDTLTVNILGRDINARIASLRRVNWDTMGFNYVLVFSPNTLRSAPHSLTATIDAPGDGGARATRAILAAFPSASVIEVGDIIDQVGGLIRQMAGAILAAASVTILAGVAVLIGAIAAGREARAYDNVMLKVLGATRRQLLTAQLIEYGVLALMLAVVALVLGGIAAWAVLTQVFEFGFRPDWLVVACVLIGGALVTLGIGLAGSLPLLQVRPNQALRQL